MDWHGPHGGHHGFFEGAPHHHGSHGGPYGRGGQKIHGHGPHGGHPKSQMVDYADGMDELLAQNNYYARLINQARNQARISQERKEDRKNKKRKPGHGHGHGRNHRGGGGY